jgi:protein SCO1/2
MRAQIAFCLGVSLVIAACNRSSADRTYPVQGQVLEVAPDHQQATVKHEEIKGLMAAMTMPYKVQDPRLLEGIAPGDLINATLVVTTNDAFLSEVRKVGEAPLEKSPAPPPASSGFELLKPGEAAPDANFVDQSGRMRSFSSFKGTPLAVTFMYTLCPLPDFCPLMDRNFAEVQRALRSDPTQTKAHLVSISIDPVTDTPAVLSKHASKLQADPAIWTFLTGDRDEVDRFASRFGMTITRSQTDAIDIAHTLRTAIVDADGKLVKVYTGQDWKPDQIVADLKALKKGTGVN